MVGRDKLLHHSLELLPADIELVVAVSQPGERHNREIKSASIRGCRG